MPRVLLRDLRLRKRLQGRWNVAMYKKCQHILVTAGRLKKKASEMAPSDVKCLFTS